EGLRQFAVRAVGDRARTDRPQPEAAGRLQVPAQRRDPRRTAENDHRQDPAPSAARNRSCGSHRKLKAERKQMSKRFDGKTAIVTGASRGIGLAIAERLVSEGAKVCITARKPEPLAEAVETLGGAENAIAVPGKGDDPEHHAEAVRKTVETFGGVDLLVNNTGINPVYGPLVDLDLAAARKVFEVNVLGALSWTQHAYRAWMKDHGGAVLNLSSVAGL